MLVIALAVIMLLAALVVISILKTDYLNYLDDQNQSKGG
jgi:archaellum component FlaF (FlaF/FlaG flagellin family)